MSTRFLEILLDSGGSSFLSPFSVFALTEKYKLEFSNPNSLESKFIEFLLTSSNNNEYEIVKKAIYELYYENYISNLISFLNNERKALNFENLKNYLEFKESEYINKIKEDFINRTYKTNGNFFMFLSNNVFNDPSVALLKKIDDFNFDKYLLSPRIDYMGNNSYKNLREAELDYWEILRKFALSKGFSFNGSSPYGMVFTLSFGNDVSKDLIATLFNKSYKSINGNPVFLKNSYFKGEFSSSNSQNEIIKDILVEDFSLLSEDFFNNGLEKMFQELSKYKKENNFVWDDASFLENFLNSKLSAFSSKSYSLYTLEDLKELKFYKITLSKFLNISSSSFQKEEQLTTELKALKNLINEAKDNLRQNGKFK
jgi:dihydroorotate dehydrogenase